MHTHAPDHDHSHSAGDPRPFRLALIVTFAFALIEAAGGWWSGSLALLGDAGHMVSDTAALGLAALGAWIASRPATERHSYGLGRAEVVAAIINALLMMAVVLGIGFEAIQRLRHPEPVHGGMVMVIAFLGLLVNILVARILHGGQSLNAKAALIHVLGDLLGSVAALASGAVIALTGWLPIDPILSLFISVLILISSIRLLGQALHVVLEGVPDELDLTEIGESMTAVAGVDSIHDLHVWTVSSDTVALSAHIGIASMGDWPGILAGLQEHLHASYGIDHATLQPELTVHILQPMPYERDQH